MHAGVHHTMLLYNMVSVGVLKSQIRFYPVRLELSGFVDTIKHWVMKLLKCNLSSFTSPLKIVEIVGLIKPVPDLNGDRLSFFCTSLSEKCFFFMINFNLI